MEKWENGNGNGNRNESGKEQGKVNGRKVSVDNTSRARCNVHMGGCSIKTGSDSGI